MTPFWQRTPTRSSAEPNGYPERQAVVPATTSTPVGRSGLVPPRPGPKRLLWEVIVDLGFVDEQRVLEAESAARAARQDLGTVLLERGLVSTDQLARAVADREGLAFVDLETFEVDEQAASMITPAVAERYGAVLIGYGDNGHVLLAVSNPRDHHAINDIAMMVDPPVTRVVATSEEIEALIRRRQEAAYSEQGDEEREEVPVAEPSPQNEEDPVTFEVESAREEAPDLVVARDVVPDLPQRPSPAEDERVDIEEPRLDAEEPRLDIEEPRLDTELLESLALGVGELERLVREGAGDRDRERDAARAQVERQVEELRTELEGERAERAEVERALREELETERATREAIASELAAVRTARDDLARCVASARDLLDLGARPHLHVSGRDQ